MMKIRETKEYNLATTTLVVPLIFTSCRPRIISSICAATNASVTAFATRLDAPASSSLSKSRAACDRTTNAARHSSSDVSIAGSDQSDGEVGEGGGVVLDGSRQRRYAEEGDNCVGEDDAVAVDERMEWNAFRAARTT